jgi:hypothetical protein
MCFLQARSSSTGSGVASDCKKRPSEEKTRKVKKSKQEGSKASTPDIVRNVISLPFEKIFRIEKLI